MAQDRTINPPPIYDVQGWVTLEQAAEIRTKLRPPVRGRKVNHVTISRWQSAGYIQAMRLNDSLVLVNLQQVIDFEGLPIGKPTLDGPDVERAKPIGKEIQLTLKRRAQPRPPTQAKKK